MSEVEETVDALEELGLTEYEARCFVALSRLPHGTAREIAQVADIPRSRVYETMERLRNRGLVELHEAEPRAYQGVPVDTAVQLLRDEYDSYFDTIERTLHRLKPTYKESAQAVWAINTRDQVTGRVVDLVDDARDEIVIIVLDEALLDDPVLEALATAGDRGVTIHVGATADAVRERVEDAEVDVHLFSTELIEWFAVMSGSPRIGRMLMVDREPVLTSALHEEELPGVPNETAVWSDGIDHGFATFMERVLTYELKEHVVEAEDGMDPG